MVYVNASRAEHLTNVDRSTEETHRPVRPQEEQKPKLKSAPAPSRRLLQALDPKLQPMRLDPYSQAVVSPLQQNHKHHETRADPRAL